ncbi:hypothetical protein [Crenothrix sp.]|uniref:hypothetical protein n=1 Tax=Crenothrix sp. TaxID=3100433 RepID=UPI00374D07E0
MTKRIRTPKQNTGAMLWIPSTCMAEVKTIIERDAQQRLAIKTDRLNKQRLAIEKQLSELNHSVLNKSESELSHSIDEEEPSIIGVDTHSPDSLEPTITHTKPSEPTQDAPETKQPETTPVKSATVQTEWLEPAPIQTHADYDGTTALKEALEKLYGKNMISNQVAAMTEQAVSALGIVRGVDKLGRPSLIKDTPRRLIIYQWHVANKQN